MLTDKPHSWPEGIRLEALVDPTHPLVKLTQHIEWEQFTQAFGALYSEDGRPSVPVRVMSRDPRSGSRNGKRDRGVGLHYLKHMFNESDESVVTKWVENPYWQYLCGCETFQHKLPCHPTSLVKWRKRIGVEGMEQLLKGVIATAMKVDALKPESIKHVTADTTVQEKAIAPRGRAAFPTDARLYHKARRALVRAAKREEIKLRQTYARASPVIPVPVHGTGNGIGDKQVLYQHSRYAVAQHMKRAARETRKLRSMLGRVMRDVQRKVSHSSSHPSAPLQHILKIAQRIFSQQRRDSPKLYSVHAPEVECIAKGKVHKKYEFGCKVAMVSTTADNWIVGIQAHHGNPYDGETLKPALAQVEQLTGIQPEQALVDQGFRGNQHHPADVNVLVVGRRKVSEALKKLFHRRSAIEPVISHTKHDHRLERNHLLGKTGDKINALLTACGFNLAKLMRFFSEAEPVWCCA